VRPETLLQRWIAFNGVGAVGMAVQLAVLALLVRAGGVHYLWATLVAVEAAVLHNFVWHERWTWRARPAGSRRQIGRRLLRFHCVNGAISIAGNLALMRLLTGTLHIDPLASNIVSVLVCSIANFAASELVVFTRIIVVVVTVAIAAPSAATAGPTPPPDTSEVLIVDLQSRTLEAWTAYERRVDERLAAATPATSPFFALDAFAAKDWRQTAMGHGIAMARIERATPGGSEVAVPDGKIHHWAGAIYVPKTTVAAVLERLSKLAGHESEHYQDVIASKLISRDGDRYRLFMKLRRSKVVTVTYNSEHAVEYRRIGTARAGARSASLRIAEQADAETPSEREKPVGSDSGYLWRLNAYWRYEAVGDGVLIECESVSLSRGVPTLLRPFITGTVEGLARESLERTLTGLRTYLARP
jgi:putative flippase GtrA